MRYSLFVIDDDQFVRESLTAALKTENDVRAFPDAESALSAVAQRNPDLVLLDIGLPEMDGMEALSRIKGINPEILVIDHRKERFQLWLNVDANFDAVQAFIQNSSKPASRTDRLYADSETVCVCSQIMLGALFFRHDHHSGTGSPTKVVFSTQLIDNCPERPESS